MTKELHIADVTRGSDRCGRLDHSLGDVGADHVALLAHRRGEAQRDEPGAAGDVEHAFAALRRHDVQHQVMRGRELRLPALLIVADRAIPAVALDAALKFRIRRIRLPGR